VQKPHPPIWIGGHSGPAIRRAARLGDGWHPVGANPAVPLRPAELKTSLDELFRLARDAGRDPSTLTISYKAPVYDTTAVTLDGKERRPFTGSVDQVVEDIGTWKKLGVSELVFDFRSETLNDTLDRMEQFATTVKRAADRAGV
jgi:alkanesulfonate monooxygenase SsuD/methylene tetrahydromethanopterin reductase-like flavin-dependent oxidoreductase (luciferase family)